MKLSVSRDEMQEKLANIQNIVEKKNTMPILSHFLLSAGKKGSYIIATDIETALKEPLNVTIEKEGKLCIPARKLFEIVREMEGELSFEAVNEQWLRVKSGASDFKLACLPQTDFPAWPSGLGGDTVEEITVDAPVLLEMIEKTLYSAGESDTRYTLNGLLFHVKPENKTFTAVGTDGHRLALIIRPIETELKEEKRLIVPRKAVSELRRFLSSKAEGNNGNDKVKMSIGEKHVLFGVGNIQFLTRLIDGAYPNYENVLPQSNERKMSIGRDAFVRVLRRVSVMSRERASAVRFDLEEDKLTVLSSSPELGEAKEEIAVDYKSDTLTLGFNARYVLDVLGAMTSETVTFELQDPLSPVLVKEGGNEEYKCVIMPMRI
jgi:DNA polymerase III subunit beta